MTTSLDTIRAAVTGAPDLTALKSALNAAEEALRDAREADSYGEPTPDWYADVGGGIEQVMGIDLSSLPLYSTREMEHTEGIYSYDDACQLVPTDSGWSIEERHDRMLFIVQARVGGLYYPWAWGDTPEAALAGGAQQGASDMEWFGREHIYEVPTLHRAAVMELLASEDETTMEDVDRIVNANHYDA